MFLGPPAVEPTERARAEVNERALEIYEDTKRDVDAEVARLDAAKVWAIAEMDRVTAEAIRRLDAGGDPEVVERWTTQEIAAVVERASAPGFDPRPVPTPSRPVEHAAAPIVPTPIAAAPIEAPSIAPPAGSADVAPTTSPPVAASGCEAHGCGLGHGSRDDAIAGWMPWILALWRRRRTHAAPPPLADRAPSVCTVRR
ncbi:MAG: hypothetical protein JNK45_28150 [Myxococcales bacterium]|nr:hypothetical protein [Myxococcales bacterium]